MYILDYFLCEINYFSMLSRIDIHSKKLTIGNSLHMYIFYINYKKASESRPVLVRPGGQLERSPNPIACDYAPRIQKKISK